MRKKINNFTGNVPTWLQLSELKIDYYTQFVKAWIPFNAWYTVCYYSETLDTDRKIINEIKNNSNPFRDRIINLLQGSDRESRDFRHHVGQLHLELEAHSIPNHDNKICFTSICIERNPKTQSNLIHRKLNYKVDFNITAPKTSLRLKCEIVNLSTARNTLHLLEYHDWSMENLLNDSKYIALKTEHREKLRLCFEDINPNKPVNIVLKPKVSMKNNKYIKPADCLVIDGDNNVYFDNDAELISKVIIEILYSLRCSLFHGEINPTETNQVSYKYSYYILKMIITELK